MIRTAYQNAAMSVRSILSNKVRSFLTALGVMIGVGAVIGLTALGQGARVSVEDRLGQLGANLLIVYSGEPRGTALVRTRTTNIRPQLTPDDLEYILSLSDMVNHVAPKSSMNAQVKFENQNISATLIGTYPDYSRIRNSSPVHGRFVAFSDLEDRSRVAVIGIDIYRNLFPDARDPLGLTIRLNGQPYRVVGVMEEKGNPSQDSTVFVPFSTYQRVHSGDRNYAIINIQAADADIMYELQDRIESQLMRFRRIPSMDFADFHISNQLDIIGAMTGVADTFTLLLAGIAAISLLVGGIGIMNIMLVSVSERTREIGVRMALGAKAGNILGQFLTEAAILGAGGGLIGVALGYGFSWAATRFGGMASHVSLDSVILAFGFALGTGIFFGGYPAWRASRMDPIEALRHE